MVKAQASVDKAKSKYAQEDLKFQKAMARGKLSPEKELKWRGNLLKLNSEITQKEAKLQSAKLQLERIK